MKRATKILRAVQIFAVIIIGSMIACKVIQPKVITVPTDKVVVTEKIKEVAVNTPSQTYYIKDSTVCPPSNSDTTIYKTFTYKVEGKTVYVNVPYHDTLRITNDTNYIKSLVTSYEKSLAEQKALTESIVQKNFANNLVYGIFAIIVLALLIFIGFWIAKNVFI